MIADIKQAAGASNGTKDTRYLVVSIVFQLKVKMVHEYKTRSKYCN